MEKGLGKKRIVEIKDFYTTLDSFCKVFTNTHFTYKHEFKIDRYFNWKWSLIWCFI